MDEWEIYVWPKGHEDGADFPPDFHERLSKALREAGIEWEHV